MTICLICANPINIKRIFDIPCLWDDECNSGRPICNDCLKLLMELAKENKKIKLSWKGNPYPCLSEIRKIIGYNQRDPQRKISDFMEV